MIINRDVERKPVTASLLKDGSYHSGQVCVSVQRVFVPADEAADFAAELGRAAEGLVVGDPAEPETQCGPLIRPDEVSRVGCWVDEAIEAGGTLVTGGKRLSDTLYSPTVILNPPEHVKVSREEIFGPVICVYGYDDIDMAIKQANALPYAFQAAVFTDRLSVANHCVRALGGAVMVNDHTAFRVDWMPFAGLRLSGPGVGGIQLTFFARGRS